ncbi:MAG: AsmA-like C-terminal region-containing protein, partial [Gammaproteobacteria bacterium]|nr:AsmA-like C-terminal region-containing protein [Gammaproteobacteria bacterium]
FPNFLKNFSTGKIKIKVGNLFLNEKIGEDFNLEMTLNNGILIIDDISSQAYDGKININGSLDISSGKLISILSFSLANSLLEGVLGDLFRIDFLKDGKLSISGNIFLEGNNMEDMIKNINGDIIFAARGFSVLGFGLDGFVDNIFTSSNRSELVSITEKFLHSDKTIFTSLDGKASIKNGVASSTSQFRSIRTAGNIAMNFDLFNQVMNGIMRFVFIPISGSVETIGINMSLKGLITNPQRSIDMKALNELVFMGIDSFKN